jgi:hypothetical protein
MTRKTLIKLTVAWALVQSQALWAADDRTFCSGKIIAWNIYEISFEPYKESTAGRMSFWAGFNQHGDVIPALYLLGYDTLFSSTDVTVNILNTNFSIGVYKSNKAKSCYGTLRWSGLTQSEYAYEIRGSGFISAGEVDLNELGSAQFFTLNNSLITYAGNSYWGKLTFTRMR